jgi:hypothetical protein
MRAARSLTPRTPPATGDVALVWRARPLVPLGERYDVCRAPGRLNPGGDIVSVLDDLILFIAAQHRDARSEVLTPDQGSRDPSLNAGKFTRQTFATFLTPRQSPAEPLV